MPDRAGADIVLVNPRFEASYWGLEGALPLLGKRTAMPVASLPLLAALTPPPHRVRIVDENVTPIDFDEIARADIVGLTGMSVQRTRMREILSELARRNTFTVVGGPWVSVDECGWQPGVRGLRLLASKQRNVAVSWTTGGSTTQRRVRTAALNRLRRACRCRVTTCSRCRITCSAACSSREVVPFNASSATSSSPSAGVPG